jgi:hypothetical protein
MRRRDFITLVGSAAVWPAAAIAQQNNKKRLVGVITGFNDKEMMPLFAAFRTRMQELGWIESQTLISILGPRAEIMQSWTGKQAT